jgi:hypothetical protein
MWFLLEGLDSVSAIMESVAVLLTDELKDQDTNSIVAPLHPFFHIANPRMGISLNSSDSFYFCSDRFFHFESEQLCQCVQLIYLHSSRSFLVPSYAHSLSIQAGTPTELVF